ncbi:hypothetical protein WAI453_010701 [Rhynchosporium graminicola]
MHSPNPQQKISTAQKLDQQGPSKKTLAGDSNASHDQIQVIICSCSSHLINPKNTIHILQPHATLPTLTALLSILFPALSPTPSSTASYLSTQSPTTRNTLTAFQLAQAHLQTLNIPSRASRYIANPFEIPGLLNRMRINVQGLLSVRLWFNIWCVVVWVLIRRFLEIFGVKIGGTKGA